MATTTTPKPASDKQRAFAQKLDGERVVPDGIADGNLWERYFDLVFDPSKFISSREASAVINWLLSLPRKEQEQPEIGVYVLPDGRIVKTQQNKAKTNVYTKLWVPISGERLNELDGRKKGEWDYQPALKGELATGRKMTLEEAKEFILVYGQCVRCARTLKAADSVERGIGPVCIQYFSF